MVEISETILSFNRIFSRPDLHPYVSVGDFSDLNIGATKSYINFHCYCVLLLESGFGEIYKGRTVMRYRSHSMVAIKPGETLHANFIEGIKPKGRVLIFTPEFVENSSLKKDFFMFNFFDYDASETLELTDEEFKAINVGFNVIEMELRSKRDDMTSYMLRLFICVLLTCCKRYYDRQFGANLSRVSDFMLKLNELLDEYYAPDSRLPIEVGYPTVAWCAEQFELHPSVFGNMVRRQAHVSAQDYIHTRIIDKAKSELTTSDISVDALAKMLGFTYPNHFTRFFKKETGMSPMQYRRLR